MNVIDANVLLNASNEDAPAHTSSRAWLQRALAGPEALAFTWPVLVAFLRLATHRAVFAAPLPVPAAIGQIRTWLAAPCAVILEPTARHLDVLAGLLVESGTAGNLVSDADLAALAIEHDATVVTFDADFGRFAGVRWMRPAA